jgi:lauroyl/myristoyl acyltransferase
MQGTRADWMQGLGRWLPAGSGARRGAIRLALRSGVRPAAPTRRTDGTLPGLRRVFPGLGERALIRLSRLHDARMYDFGLTRHLLISSSEEEVAEIFRTRVDVEGSQNLERIRRHDGPVVAFTPHYGVPILGLIGLMRAMHAHKRVNTFYASPEENPSTVGYREIIDKAGAGVNVLHDDGRGVRGALSGLRRGEVLTMMPDVYDNRHNGAMLVPFLGGFTPAMGGTAFFALRSNALLVPAYAYQTGRFRYTLRFDSPIEFVRTNDFEADVYRVTAAIHADMEAQIRRAPEHWAYWSHIEDRLVRRLPLPVTDSAEAWRPLLASFAGPETDDFLEKLSARLDRAA